MKSDPFGAAASLCRSKNRFFFKKIIFGPLPGAGSSSNGNWGSSDSNTKESLVSNSADSKSESPF